MNIKDFKVISITPDYAKKLLEKNPINRKLYKSNVKRYAVAMGSDAWKPTHQNIIATTKDGLLVDGQHRLHAIVMLNKPVEMMIFNGAKEEDFAYIDQGKTRNGYDVFTIASLGNYNVAAIARQVFLYHIAFDELTWWKATAQITSAELVNWAQGLSPVTLEPIYKTLHDGCRAEQRFRKQVKKLGSIIGASLTIYSLKTGIPVEILWELVFTPITTFIGLESGTPVYALHKILQKQRYETKYDGIFAVDKSVTIDKSRARLSALLQVIDDTVTAKRRTLYKFEMGAPMYEVLPPTRMSAAARRLIKEREVTLS